MRVFFQICVQHNLLFSQKLVNVTRSINVVLCLIGVTLMGLLVDSRRFDFIFSNYFISLVEIGMEIEMFASRKAR